MAPALRGLGRRTIAGRPALLGSQRHRLRCPGRYEVLVVTAGGLYLGVVARWTDVSNYLRAAINPETDVEQGLEDRLTVEKVVGGTTDRLGSDDTERLLGSHRHLVHPAADSRRGGQLGALGLDRRGAGRGGRSPGRTRCWPRAGRWPRGGWGFYDVNTSATASTRNYDNFATWSPDANAVMFASQSMELATTGITREDSGGERLGGGARSLRRPAADAEPLERRDGRVHGQGVAR